MSLLHKLNVSNLSFLKSQSITDRTNSASQISFAYEFAMANSGAQFQSGGASSSHFVNNFTGNIISPSTLITWIPNIPFFQPVLLIDKLLHLKIGSWTRAIDHIVHSITHLTAIIFVINTIVHLPIAIGETTLITHIGTVKT